jgi:large subunit ribosomal protein L29
MKAGEIREKSSDQIQTDIQDALEELMNLRFQREIGQLTDSSLRGRLKRDIARMRTVLREREISGEQ